MKNSGTEQPNNVSTKDENSSKLKGTKRVFARLESTRSNVSGNDHTTTTTPPPKRKIQRIVTD